MLRWRCIFILDLIQLMGAGLDVIMQMILYYKQHEKFPFPPFARLYCGALTCSLFKKTLSSGFAALFCHPVGESKAQIVILLIVDFQNRVFIQLLPSKSGLKRR